MRFSSKNRRFALISTDSAKVCSVETWSFGICLLDLFGEMVFVRKTSVKDFERSEAVKNTTRTIVVFKNIGGMLQLRENFASWEIFGFSDDVFK